MTNQDRAAFGRMMFALGDTFHEPVTELRVEAYFDALRDLPIADVLVAGRAAIRDARFFPRPIELREHLDGKVEDQAELAWVAVQREVRRVGYTGTPTWPDEATRRAAMELYGGWTALCECLPATGPEMLGTAKLFKAIFAAHARRDVREQIALPPSRDEATQRLHGLKLELVERGLPAGDL